jgi:hypothetical protein
MQQSMLFVNGVNTSFGGSGAESMRTWKKSFQGANIQYDYFHTVPNLGLPRGNIRYLIFLVIYFLPGSIFRFFKFPLFEFFYKLSVINVFLFYRVVCRGDFFKVVFSHHSSFYLSLIVPYFKRVFLIHDLMYVRVRSMGGSAMLQRICLNIELRIYRRAPHLLVLSYHEMRVLKKFLNNNISLIRCCDLDNVGYFTQKNHNYAVISDWRRSENIHGISQFLLKSNSDCSLARNFHLRIYGFGSNDLISRLSAQGVIQRLNITNGGIFNEMSEVNEMSVLVPIYHGAGIKRKTLEAIVNGRMVFGTKEAFIGIPRRLISKVSRVVTSMNDLGPICMRPSNEVFIKTLSDLRSIFLDISKALESDSI